MSRNNTGMKISFSAPRIPRRGALVVGVFEGGRFDGPALQAEEASAGALSRAVAASRFTGKVDQNLTLLAPSGLSASRVLVQGLGKADELGAREMQVVGGTVAAALAKTGDKAATVSLGADLPAELAAHLGFGALLRSYRFDRYKTGEKPENKPSLAAITVATGAHRAARDAFAPLAAVAEGVFLARDLVSEPPNVLFPESFAERVEALGEDGLSVEILGEEEMAALGMGALLGVAQGSARKPRMAVLRWQGMPEAEDQTPIAFVGKGVTFDTGGISIKPGAGMEEMKWDMAGAAVVVGLMKALAGRKARVNAVGLVGLVENMPSGTAQRPGDVVTTMSGQTVEIINTDAEGRLVLADVLWYCEETVGPHSVIDLATLTGAIMMSLGSENAGLFANDDALSERLLEAGKAVGESVWRMPLGEAYDKQIDSDIADMKNLGEREGGAITAAQFLQRFIKDGVRWAHLDIAGVAWSKQDKPVVPKGGTAFGVRLLDELVRAHYEH